MSSRGFCGWLADRAILRPSTHSVFVEGKKRLVVNAPGGEIELWGETHAAEQTAGPAAKRLIVLKCIGAGGRAERATLHPLEYWNARGEVWALNPPGYGGSAGKATLPALLPSALAAYDAVAQGAGVTENRAAFADDAANSGPERIVLTGNSLGCAVALAVAAQRRPAGLILRNPPPLRETIWRRFGLATLGLCGLAAVGVPVELDSLANARRCACPAVFLCAQQDRIVPPSLQERIFSAYAGPKRIVRLPSAGHHYEGLTEAEQREYAAALDWLRSAGGI